MEIPVLDCKSAGFQSLAHKRTEQESHLLKWLGNIENRRPGSGPGRTSSYRCRDRGPGWDLRCGEPPKRSIMSRCWRDKVENKVSLRRDSHRTAHGPILIGGTGERVSGMFERHSIESQSAILPGLNRPPSGATRKRMAGIERRFVALNGAGMSIAATGQGDPAVMLAETRSKRSTSASRASGRRDAPFAENRPRQYQMQGRRSALGDEILSNLRHLDGN